MWEKKWPSCWLNADQDLTANVLPLFCLNFTRCSSSHSLGSSSYRSYARVLMSSCRVRWCCHNSTTECYFSDDYQQTFDNWPNIILFADYSFQIFVVNQYRSDWLWMSMSKKMLRIFSTRAHLALLLMHFLRLCLLRLQCFAHSLLNSLHLK